MTYLLHSSVFCHKSWKIHKVKVIADNNEKKAWLKESVSWLNPQIKSWLNEWSGSVNKRFRSRQRLELFSLLLVFHFDNVLALSFSWDMEQGNYPFFFKALGKGKRKQKKYICILKIKNGKEKKDTSENML